MHSDIPLIIDQLLQRERFQHDGIQKTLPELLVFAPEVGDKPDDVLQWDLPSWDVHPGLTTVSQSVSDFHAVLKTAGGTLFPWLLIRQSVKVILHQKIEYLGSHFEITDFSIITLPSPLEKIWESTIVRFGALVLFSALSHSCNFLVRSLVCCNKRLLILITRFGLCPTFKECYSVLIAYLSF